MQEATRSDRSKAGVVSAVLAKLAFLTGFSTILTYLLAFMAVVAGADRFIGVVLVLLSWITVFPACVGLIGLLLALVSLSLKPDLETKRIAICAIVISLVLTLPLLVG